MTFSLTDTIKNSFPSIFDDGKKIADAVTVIFGSSGQVYDSWQSVSIMRSLESVTGTFNVTLVDKWDEQNSSVADLASQAVTSLLQSPGAAGKAERKWPFQPGESVHIKIGKTPVISGYIDRVDVSMSNEERLISVQGRDKTGDLVDSSAYIPNQSLEFKNLDIVSLANIFTSRFNIKTTAAAGVDIGARFPKFTVKQGETVFEMLERAAKLRGLLMLSTETGDLQFTNRAGGDIGAAPAIKSATSDSLIAKLKKAPSIASPKAAFDFATNAFKPQAETQLVQGENILEARAQYDHTDRFDTYIVKGQQPSDDLQNKLQTQQVTALAFDRRVGRERPKIILADGSVSLASAQKRANWENIVRATKSLDVTVKVQGWEEQPDSGKLWTVNQLVKLKAPKIGLKEQQMLITQVSFAKSLSGTFTTIKLSRPDAYDISKQELSFDSDPSKDIGHDTPGLSDLASQAKNVLNKVLG